MSRVANRPEMLALERVLTYAAAHDARALEAYCSSPDVARRLLRWVPSLDLTVEDERVARDVVRLKTGGGLFTLKRVKRRWGGCGLGAGVTYVAQ